MISLMVIILNGGGGGGESEKNKKRIKLLPTPPQSDQNWISHNNTKMSFQARR